MTRNRELDCEDIFGCAHEPEIAILKNGEITGWACRCGRVKEAIDLAAAGEVPPKDGQK